VSATNGHNITAGGFFYHKSYRGHGPIPGKDCERYCLGIRLVLPGYGDETAVFVQLENLFVTKQHLSKGERLIITSYHIIGPYDRCETIASFLPKCQNLPGLPTHFFC